MNQMDKNNDVEEFDYNESNSFIKKNVELHEYTMHKMVYNMNIVNIPKIYKYDKETKTMYLQKISDMNVSDRYGEDIKEVPTHILEKIQEIIKTLYYRNILYPDITGYNFIEHKGKIWIIDFEHSEVLPIIRSKQTENARFVQQFIEKKKVDTWNPEFK
jgi:tRNA A-37 threonylcarbamoyl transferase component Bud32